MILVIRISGMVEVPTTVNDTLSRIRLRRKYAAVLMKETEDNYKLLSHVRNFVAFGTIDNATLIELIAKRGQVMKGKKIDAAKVAAEVEKKSLPDLGLKPFFRLHPPRGGIKSKLHYPLTGGVLGDNKADINVLVRRML
ncbi:hypothetical protein EXS73_03395 [Candidatus Pacearchaeota archaeon]|nr:hypothetical protein [Candidatus Pacearchaeota archaeon]